MPPTTITKLPTGTWERIADLPLEIDSITLIPREHRVGPEFTSRTPVIRLEGAGLQGVGEDVTPTEAEHLAFQRSGPPQSLTGRWTLGALGTHLESTPLFDTPPPSWMPHTFRRWGFESAALDLALRQAGQSLSSVLRIEPRPVRFVNSLRRPAPDHLGHPDRNRRRHHAGRHRATRDQHQASPDRITQEVARALRPQPLDRSADVRRRDVRARARTPPTPAARGTVPRRRPQRHRPRCLQRRDPHRDAPRSPLPAAPETLGFGGPGVELPGASA